MTVNIEELLDELWLPDKVKRLALDNIEVTPTVSYEVSSSCSNYIYNEHTIEDKDHMWQLVTDIIIANLDKVNYVNNKLYDLKKDNKYWLVNRNEVPVEIIITDIMIYCEIEEDVIVIKEHANFTKLTNDSNHDKGIFLNYPHTYNSHMSIFNTREEAVTFFKKKFDL